MLLQRVVVAAVIERAGRVLVCRRRNGQPHALKWEFPGGKVEPGETPRDALRRELEEELGIAANTGPEIARYPFCYPGKAPIELIFYSVTEFTGEPRNRVFERIEWARREALPGYDFLEGDVDFVKRLANGGNTSRVLTINGGSSTIKFAVYTQGESPQRLLKGQIENIGQPGTVLTASTPDGSDTSPIEAADHRGAALALIDWLTGSNAHVELAAISHRVVHGGLHLNQHQLVTPALLDELRRMQPLDLTHLPLEISLIEAFQERFRDVPQVACFDSAFHRNLPRVAQLLPIPRRYWEEGVRRLGFHGLSYTYLMGELQRVAGEAAANGRVILAHLGSGASMAAVRAGEPIDTTMAFTPAAGLMMGTRPGDLDPGLLVYLMRVEKMTPAQMDDFVSHCCGLAGVSDTTSDVRALTARRGTDPRAAEALDLFCYQAKKWLGAYAAALGGVETLVFSGGIGEHSPDVRAAICNGLEFLGLRLDPGLNAASAPVISAADSRVTVRVIPTDEEAVMARIVFDVIMKA